MGHAQPQVGDVIAGKYRIESVLGRGGMGVVYAARHTISERRVAVKWMEADLQNEPEALERFVREAKAMGRIDHPNVVGVLDVGTEGDIAYLVMEILRGESLRSLLSREKKLAPELAIRTLLPVMEGVEAAHRAGVVHRDLKPENLFVVRGPGGDAQTTKVLDFGISKLTENESKRRDAKKLTKTGHVVGTPTYMSPEQVRGVTIDARTDVWALSTILYEALTGRTPFEGDNYGALLVAIAVEPYEPLDPRLVPPDLARIVHKGLAKEPEDRWQTVLDLARALAPFAPGAKVAEPQRPSIAPPPEERVSSTPTAVSGKLGKPLPASPMAAGPMAAGPMAAGPMAAGPMAAGPMAASAPRAELAPTVPPLALPATVPAGARTPDLDVAALRPLPAASAPGPLRVARPSKPETAEVPEAPRSAGGKVVTIAAVAALVLIALVLVIRGIGNATRGAAVSPESAPSEAPVRAATHEAATHEAATHEAATHEAATHGGVTYEVTAPVVPPPQIATPEITAGIDPPPPLPVPELPLQVPPITRARHGETRPHAPAPSSTGTPAPSGTAASSTPSETTSGSRSGSIRREDF